MCIRDRSGTVLSPALLARMAREIQQVAYFKIETAGAASKLRELLRLGGDAIEGPWDGEEGIFPMEVAAKEFPNRKY